MRPRGTAPSFGPEAASLALPLPGPYVFKSQGLRTAMGLVDAVGDALLAPKAANIEWSRVKRIAVLRLDHLGDLLQTLPALRRLKRALPQARIDLWVGPWGQELAGLFADVDAIRVTPAPWFQRPRTRRWPGAAIAALADGLREQGYDASLDLRGDLRHHLAARRAGIPIRIGQTLTGGSFLLTHPVRWDAALHEQEQNLSLLDQAGLPAAIQGSATYLRLPAPALKKAQAVAKSLKLGAGPILVQAATGADAKRWLPGSWAAVLQSLPAGVPIALLGSAAEREEMLSIAKRVKRPVAVAAGLLDLSSLAALIKTARLMLSVDSGPAHLAAVQGVPVVSLFSGTNRASQWAPRDPALRPSKGKVQVLQAPNIPCSPCELSVCPYGNACMAAIDTATVLAAARKLLRTA